MAKTQLEPLIFLGFAALIVTLLASLFVFRSPATTRIIGPCLVAAILGLAVFATFIAFRRDQQDDPDAPTVVASMSDEMSASAIVVQLESHGITARAIGGHTAGDLACDVKVVVAAKDYELAMGMMQVIEEDNT